MRAADFDDGFSSKDLAACQHVVSDGAERVNVDTSVDRFGRDDGFRSQVKGRTGQRAGDGQSGVCLDGELFDEPEIEELHDVILAALLAEHDVGGLDVAVDESDTEGF